MLPFLWYVVSTLLQLHPLSFLQHWMDVADSKFYFHMQSLSLPFLLGIIFFLGIYLPFASWYIPACLINIYGLNCFCILKSYDFMESSHETYRTRQFFIRILLPLKSQLATVRQCILVRFISSILFSHWLYTNWEVMRRKFK